MMMAMRAIITVEVANESLSREMLVAWYLVMKFDSHRRHDNMQTFS
jgi:hypothetical protein